MEILPIMRQFWQVEKTPAFLQPARQIDDIYHKENLCGFYRYGSFIACFVKQEEMNLPVRRNSPNKLLLFIKN